MGPVKRAEIEPRAVVTWEGPGEPIMLTLYGPGGEVAVPLAPKRALTPAQNSEEIAALIVIERAIG